MSSASVEVVEDHVDSWMTIIARTVVVDRFATWKVTLVWSAEGNWVSGSPIRK
jgi:hypothetical protein